MNYRYLPQIYDEEGTPAARSQDSGVACEIYGSDAAQVPCCSYVTRTSSGVDYFVSFHLNESHAVGDRTIRKRKPAHSPVKSAQDLILSGTHFFVANPFYKTPRRVYDHNNANDTIDLTSIPDDYLPRSNFERACTLTEYRSRSPKVPWQNNAASVSILDQYRVAVVNMVGPFGERTHRPALIPPGFGHVHEHRQQLLVQRTLTTFSRSRVCGLVGASRLFCQVDRVGSLPPQSCEATATWLRRIRRAAVSLRVLGSNSVTSLNGELTTGSYDSAGIPSHRDTAGRKDDGLDVAWTQRLGYLVVSGLTREVEP